MISPLTPRLPPTSNPPRLPVVDRPLLQQQVGNVGGRWKQHDTLAGSGGDADFRGLPLPLTKQMTSEGIDGRMVLRKKMLGVVLSSVLAWIGAIGCDHKNWAIVMVPSRFGDEH
ncbi:hypothetical protein ACLOJK_041647 [Asimina triloba]